MPSRVPKVLFDPSCAIDGVTAPLQPLFADSVADSDAEVVR